MQFIHLVKSALTGKHETMTDAEKAVEKKRKQSEWK